MLPMRISSAAAATALLGRPRRTALCKIDLSWEGENNVCRSPPKEAATPPAAAWPSEGMSVHRCTTQPVPDVLRDRVPTPKDMLDFHACGQVGAVFENENWNPPDPLSIPTQNHTFAGFAAAARIITPNAPLVAQVGPAVTSARERVDAGTAGCSRFDAAGASLGAWRCRLPAAIAKGFIQPAPYHDATRAKAARSIWSWTAESQSQDP